MRPGTKAHAVLNCLSDMHVGREVGYAAITRNWVLDAE